MNIKNHIKQMLLGAGLLLAVLPSEAQNIIRPNDSWAKWSLGEQLQWCVVLRADGYGNAKLANADAVALLL